MTRIPELPFDATPSTDDLVITYDNATGITKKSTVQSLVGLTTKTGIARTAGGTQQYGFPGTMFVSQGTSNLLANSIRYVPFYVTYQVILTNYLYEVTTSPATNANMRIGIYAADTNMQPTGAPLFDTGSIAVASTFTGLKNGTTNTVLTPGAYLVCATTDTQLGVRSLIAPTPVISPILGVSSLAQRFDVSQTFQPFATPAVQWQNINAVTTGLQHFVVWQWTE